MQFYKRNATLNVTTAALFVCMGALFPMIFHFTGSSLGKVLLPMHLPVILCGFICGPILGGISGLIIPLLCSLITSVPVIFPSATSMSIELATYGFLTGLLLELFKGFKSKTFGRFKVLVSLIISMLIGRIVHGIALAFFILTQGGSYTFMIFFTADFVTPWPGIVLQIIVIPAIMETLARLKILSKYNLEYISVKSKAEADTQINANECVDAPTNKVT